MTMKNLQFTLWGLLFSLVSMAQNTGEYQTIFRNSNMQITGQGGFDMQFSSLGGYYAYGAGGSGGAVLNKTLLIGGFGQEYTIDRTFAIHNVDYKNLEVGYGGLLFGYIHQGNRPMHVDAFLQVGWGALHAMDSDLPKISDNFMVLNPSVEVEFNLTCFFRIAVGGHYMFTTGINQYESIHNSDFSGSGGKLAFRFGWF
jgi:hypothetical protein